MFEARTFNPRTDAPMSSPRDIQPDHGITGASLYFDHTPELTAYGIDDFPETYPVVELKDIPMATEPGVFFQPHAEPYAPTVDIDVSQIQDWMKEVGFEDKHAEGFAVVVYDKADIPEDTVVDKLGWYNGHSHIVGDEEKVSYPVAVHVVYTGDEKDMNHTLRHEVGHAELDKVQGAPERTSFYANEAIVDRTRKAGRVTTAGGALLGIGGYAASLTGTGNFYVDTTALTVGVVATSLGSIAASAPESLLHMIDPEERYAQRFARRNKGINPIKINNQGK